MWASSCSRLPTKLALPPALHYGQPSLCIPAEVHLPGLSWFIPSMTSRSDSKVTWEQREKKNKRFFKKIQIKMFFQTFNWKPTSEKAPPWNVDLVYLSAKPTTPRLSQPPSLPVLRLLFRFLPLKSLSVHHLRKCMENSKQMQSPKISPLESFQFSKSFPVFFFDFENCNFELPAALLRVPVLGEPAPDPKVENRCKMYFNNDK